MESTRRLDIELPEDLADAIEARVSAGEYASVSDVVADGLRALAEREDDPAWDAEVEHWLKTEVAATYDRLKAGTERTYSVEEVRAYLQQARDARNAAE